MNHLNSLILEGSAGNLKTTSKYAEFQISVKRCYRNADGENVDETSVFDCVAWGSSRDLLARVFAKKSERPVRVVGRLKQEKWNESTRKSHSKVVVVCEHIEVKPTIE